MRHLVHTAFPWLSRRVVGIVDGIDITAERFEAEVTECGAATIVDKDQRYRNRVPKGRSELDLGRVRFIHVDLGWNTRMLIA